MDPIIYESFDQLGAVTAVDGRKFQQILNVGQEIRRRFPEDWRDAHNHPDPARAGAFVRRWASALRAIGIYAGVNGKRGGDAQSQDVLTFPVRHGGNRDTSGRFDRILIVDVIGGAGGPNPTLTFNDVSAPSQGRFIDVDEDPGQVEPAPEPAPVPPGPPQPSEPPVPAPAPPPAPPSYAPPIDVNALAEAILDRLSKRLDATDARIQHIIHAMFGPLESPTLLEHIDDVKRIQLQLERTSKFRKHATP